MIFRQYISGLPAPSLSSEDLVLVNKALEKSENTDNTKSDPKVIVVKQEMPREKDEEDEEDEEEWDYSQMYAYPPDYYEEYEDEEYEDEE